METKEPRKLDLFDFGTHFRSHVIVQAIFKHAALTCAAMRLGRAKGAEVMMRVNCSQRSSTDV